MQCIAGIPPTLGTLMMREAFIGNLYHTKETCIIPKQVQLLENALRTSVRLGRPPALESRDGLLQQPALVWYYMALRRSAVL
jgi:hypothetical protein